VYSRPLYAWWLRRRPPAGLLFAPPDPTAGDPAKGLQILKGRLPVDGASIAFTGFGQLAQDPSPTRRDLLHGFAWLRDLRAFGSDRAPGHARGLIDAWLTEHGRWRADSWQPHLLAERLHMWLAHFEFLVADADAAFRVRLLAALVAQARHLGRVLPLRHPNARLIRSLKGLLLCGLSLPGCGRARETALALLEREAARQVWPDGGHIERSPATQAVVLGDFLDLREALLAAHEEVPEWLQGVIDRMAPLLRALRHGDGGLALFNGATEGDRGRLDALFALSRTRGRPLSSAPHSGFHRLAAGRTLIIVDAGPPPPPGADRTAHAGTLSFELSVGRDRVIVNCGASAEGDPRWTQALRATAAHSTAVVDDVNSADVLDAGGLGRRPVDVVVNRREFDGNLLIEATHDGYREPFGMIHRRSLYLAADGEDVRGEDELSGPGKHSFAVRFHLHPGVQASMLPADGGVLLRTPSGSGWRFRADAAKISLEESVYLGTGPSRRTQQIVLGGEAADGAPVKWRLSRA